MPVFILHFDCQPVDKTATTRHQSAESCSIAETLEQAEAQARTLIATHTHSAGDLIAFARVETEEIAHLSQDEATLYLKAQQHTPPCAVFFFA
ncbi:MAG: hypothetical protein OQL08_02725 [Gammaproteobacteria bacterium]|nr:hypothetical protein [Gammaproteobacteria bacterium]